MAALGTAHSLTMLGALALLVAFSSATQDIAIDAWRIESAADADELGTIYFRPIRLASAALC